MQRIQGYLTESHRSLPFPDNKVVVIPCWAYLRERAWGDQSGTAYSQATQVALFAAVLGIATASQHPAQPWVGSTGEPSGSEVMYQPVAASPPCSPMSFQLHKGTSPARCDCKSLFRGHSPQASKQERYRQSVGFVISWATQEIPPPEITHSNPKGSLLPAFIGICHTVLYIWTAVYEAHWNSLVHSN